MGEGRHHMRYKRVFVNDDASKKEVQHNDVLHFSPALRKLAERRILKKKAKILPFEYEFEPANLRFLMYEKKKTFDHPFLHIFRRLTKWYGV